MNHRIAVSALSALLAFYFGVGHAQPPRDGNGPPEYRQGMSGRGDEFLHTIRLAEELGLSQEQTTLLRNMMYETRQKMIKLNADRESASLEIERLMEYDEADEAEVLKAVERQARINGEIAALRIKSRLHMRKVLTPEQRKHMEDLRRDMVRRRAYRLGRDGHGEPPDPPMGPPGSGQGRGGQFMERMRARHHTGPGWQDAPAAPQPSPTE